MKSKKWICMLFSVIFVLSIAACGQNTQQSDEIVEFEPEPEPEPSTADIIADDSSEERNFVELDAVWDGYTELPFDEFLKKGVPAVYESFGEFKVKSCAIIMEEGWHCEGFLDETSVTEGNKAVAYVADMVMESDGAEKKLGIKFYMELTPDNRVIAAGCESFEESEGWGKTMTADETKAMLAELTEFM